MTINEYQQLALTTLNKELSKDQVLLNGLMGLCGESGEAIDLLKKYLCHGHELDKDKLIYELGDVAWYLAIASYALNMDLEEVLRLNIEKLKKRYPGGFSSDKSINRII
jgi:NTP pyrophosphatase (non-canonical NTP hydrolase)